MALDFIRDRSQFADADMRAIDALPIGVTRKGS
jgi:hypothetical protein